MSISDIDQRIRQNRTASATLTLSHDGAPIANQDVVVEQKTHKTLFGANWGQRGTSTVNADGSVAEVNASSLVRWGRSSIGLANGELSGAEKELSEQHHAYFSQLFNQVTLPFYWGGFEPVQGETQTERLLVAARWFKDQGFVVKGHPLCWHTVTANWLLDMSNAEILAAQLGRIRREVSDFAGLIDMWDVINEPVIMPVYKKYDNGITRICKALGRIGLIRRVFDETRATNPNAVLLINDYDTSSAYELLIDECLAAGIRFDVIGIQSHMHQGYWGVEKTLTVLKRYERFGLPIHFTENSFLSGHPVPPEITDLQDYHAEDWPSTPEGEARQLEHVVSHYKTLMAHPLVEAITWWDMSDGAWLNAPSGLLRRDQTPKPAYDALLNLIKGEWWLSPTTITTDANGQLSFSGFPGTYELTVGGQKVTVALDKNSQEELAVQV